VIPCEEGERVSVSAKMIIALSVGSDLVRVPSGWFASVLIERMYFALALDMAHHVFVVVQVKLA
jgi:hypothetical protein